MLDKKLDRRDKLRETLGHWNDGINVSLDDSEKEYPMCNECYESWIMG